MARTSEQSVSPKCSLAQRKFFLANDPPDLRAYHVWRWGYYSQGREKSNRMSLRLPTLLSERIYFCPGYIFRFHVILYFKKMELSLKIFDFITLSMRKEPQKG